MVVALVCCVACSEREGQPKQQPAAAECGGTRAQLPAAFDPRSVSWQLVVPPHAAQQRLDAIVETCESWVSLAHDGGGGGKGMFFGANEVLITSDGTEWLRSTIAGVDGATFFDIARGAGHWVAVGRGAQGGGSIAVSTGGESPFRVVFTAPEWAFEHVAFGAGTFVAQSRSGLAVSHDGEHWSWSSLAPATQYFDVAFGNGRFVLAGLVQAVSSADGESWQVSSQSLLLEQIRFVGGKFYAYGASGAFESLDGSTFTNVQRMIPDAAIGGVLVRVGEAVESHGAQTTQVPDPPRVLVSQDDGNTWFSQHLTVSSAQVDCSIDPCVVVPQGILVLRPKVVDATPSGVLCDGSSEMRVMAGWGPGFPDASAVFMSPYGAAFFAIDGKCRYYAQDNPTHAIVRGQLTPEQATSLSADLAWEELPTWGHYHPETQCADAGGVVLGTRQVVFSCGPSEEIGCGCGPAAPPGLPATLKNALRWHAALVKNGTPLDGALDALAQPGSEASRPWQAWPLARSISSIPDFIVDPSGFRFDREAVRFDDPSEAALLRKLRDLQPEAARSASDSFSVREGSAAYSIFLRDVVPDADASAMQKLMQSFSFD
ncbi:MAG TPA: hypothetical protein VJV78_44870 [Polyangiales bacterium]|nr:hypothetical protein [Polyangiales bacterium]